MISIGILIDYISNMIQLNELKKGNYVYVKKVDGHINEEGEVLEMFEDGIAYSRFTVEAMGDGRGKYLKKGVDTKLLMPYAWLEPIPLTQEWFHTFLAISPFSDAKTRIGKLFFKDTQIGLIICDENWEPVAGERLIRYVHQLQNFYFQHTGENLRRRDIEDES
jgi:hypothetical protein